MFMIRLRETILTPPTRHTMAVPAVSAPLHLSPVTMIVIVAQAKRFMEGAP